MSINYIKASTLAWSDIWTEGLLQKDKAGRWDVSSSTPKYVQDYLSSIRTPSRAWNNSYAKALLTQKFAKYLTEQDPELALKLNVAEAT